MSKRLSIVPLAFGAAAAFVNEHHRHHTPPVGHKFSLGAVEFGRDGGRLCGVVIVGRPVSRMRDDGATLEVTRLCTDGTANACSFLYGAAARAAFALGYLRIGTYILETEPGTSLRAAGWKLIGERGGGSWDRASRERADMHPLIPKLLFETAV
ncbi:MAG TPA: XF1762 family protein [Stellaceae bacterium]|nr:XF1762 family protein [Stellaceae bacterium]